MLFVSMFMTVVVVFRMLVVVRMPMVVVIMVVVVMVLVLLIMMTGLFFFLLQLVLPLGVVENFAHAWDRAPWLKRIRSGQLAMRGRLRVYQSTEEQPEFNFHHSVERMQAGCN